MEESITYAKKYLEDLLSFFGLNCDVYATHEDDVIELSVPTSYLNGFLIGQHGDTLRSLQMIISTALRNQGHETWRVSVDVADYKKQRAEHLVAQVNDWLKEVVDSGKSKHLSPMNAADRRVVHQAVSEHASVTSASEGEGRDRHIVLHPAANDQPDETPEAAVADEATSDDSIASD